VRLSDFSFLADENIHPEVVAYLRAQGIDVVYVSETGMAAAEDAAEDADLLRLAVVENRVVWGDDPRCCTQVVDATGRLVRPGAMVSELRVAAPSLPPPAGLPGPERWSIGYSRRLPVA